MNESAIVLYDGNVIDYSVGNLSSVEFNFFDIWMNIKKIEKYDYDKLHFIHVHPGKMLNFSSIDVECMRGLFLALNHIINFSIVTFNNDGKRIIPFLNFTYDIINYIYQYNTTDLIRIDNESESMSYLKTEHIILLYILSNLDVK